MKKCTCRKGAIDFSCPRHYEVLSLARALNPPRSRSLWQRLLRWLGA